jgi:micrococcal nuclease
MKNPKLVMLLVVFVLALFNFFAIGQDQNLHQVLAVADGDTILVDMYGQTETIRFIGVDTPETQHPNKPVQCYGPQASQYLKNRLEGEYVRLEVDPLSDNRDRYDRLLRFVYTKDDELVNLSLVSQGYGFAVTGFKHSKLPEFVTSEAAAKNQRQGLWGSCEIENSNGYPSTTSQSISS